MDLETPISINQTEIAEDTSNNKSISRKNELFLQDIQCKNY